jgi:hypothetical protein
MQINSILRTLEILIFLFGLLKHFEMGKPEVDSSDDEEDLAKDQQPKANPIR